MSEALGAKPLVGKTAFTAEEEAAAPAEAQHLGGFRLFRGRMKEGQCPECAVVHDAEQPHNQQSLFYQYSFREKHGRWPTWADAMAHCSPEVKAFWVKELATFGVVVGGPGKPVEECVEAGAEAFREGKRLQDVPAEWSELERAAWRRGWLQTRREEQKGE